MSLLICALPFTGRLWDPLRRHLRRGVPLKVITPRIINRIIRKVSIFGKVAEEPVTGRAKGRNGPQQEV